MSLQLPPEAEALNTYRNSLASFAEDCAWTIDQTDRYNPIKKWHNEDYLVYLLNYMKDEFLAAVVKHRRMRATWAMCLTYLHDAMFFEGRFNALVSKKEEDSDDLVRRCKFIYDNIPREKLPIKPKAEYKYCVLSFPEISSIIHGFPQGPDQLRQYTCSRVGCDEFAYWPQARATFVAMKPTIEGGGKICLVSTRWPGFFKEIVEDKIEAARNAT